MASPKMTRAAYTTALEPFAKAAGVDLARVTQLVCHPTEFAITVSDVDKGGHPSGDLTTKLIRVPRARAEGGDG